MMERCEKRGGGGGGIVFKNNGKSFTRGCEGDDVRVEVEELVKE